METNLETKIGIMVHSTLPEYMTKPRVNPNSMVVRDMDILLAGIMLIVMFWILYRYVER